MLSTINPIKNLPNDIYDIYVNNFSGILLFDDMPEKLKYLKIISGINTILEINCEFSKNLQYLHLKTKYYKKLPILPDSLEVFIFQDDKYNFPIDYIPLNLNTLQLELPKYSKQLNFIDTNIEYLYLNVKSLSSI